MELRRSLEKDIIFKKIDLKNQEDLEKIFKKNEFDAVIHLAGLKSVKESNDYPSKYYENNVDGTKNLINVMQKFDVKKIVFFFFSNSLWESKIFTNL